MEIFIMAIITFIIIVSVGYLTILYNGLITVSNNIDKAWANINVLLKQRHDEIPKLITTCETYMKYEQETLEKIVAARTACLTTTTVDQSAQNENQLSKSLKTLFAVAEGYPDLKTNEGFSQLRQRISYLESQIADRREFYNDSVNTYNIRTREFPDLFIAKMLAMQAKQFFKVDDADTKDVEIKFNK